MTEPVRPPPVDTEAVRQAIREALNRRQRDDDYPVLTPAEEPESSVPLQFLSNPIMNKLLDHVNTFTIDDFTQYHDREFLFRAYRGILNREPDSGGFDNYLGKLRAGRYSRIDVLGRLRYSAEGRINKVRVKGLLLRYVIASGFHVPVVGYFIALITALVGLPSLLHEVRRLENQSFLQTEEMLRLIYDVENKQAEELTRFTERVGAIVARRPSASGAEDEAATVSLALKDQLVDQIDRIVSDYAALSEDLNATLRSFSDYIGTLKQNQRTNVTELRAMLDKLKRMDKS